jgi:hypothetical protein
MRKSTRITTKKQSRRRRYKTKCRRSTRRCVRRRTRKQYGASGKRDRGTINEEAVKWTARLEANPVDREWFRKNVRETEEQNAKRRKKDEEERNRLFRAPSVMETSKTAQNAIDMGYDSDELAKRGMTRTSLEGYARMADEHDLRLDHALENQKATLLQNEMLSQLRNLKKTARKREKEQRRREEEMAYNQAQEDRGSPDLDLSMFDDFM